MTTIFKQALQKKGRRADLLVVGLGNPGEKYEATRHNIGADVVASLVARHGGTLAHDRRRKALSCERIIADRLVAVARPTTFMNESGEAVRALIKRHGISDPLGLVIVHDELDLAPGRMKLKFGGGTAGNNGINSIHRHLKTLNFLRLRIGVGKPPGPTPGAAWVLKRPSLAERDLLNQAVAKAVIALETLITSGVEAAMNVANAP